MREIIGRGTSNIVGVMNFSDVLYHSHLVATLHEVHLRPEPHDLVRLT